MITIKVRRNENVNRVLSRFKAAVMSEGIMKAVIRQIENEQNEWRRR